MEAFDTGTVRAMIRVDASCIDSARIVHVTRPLARVAYARFSQGTVFVRYATHCGWRMVQKEERQIRDSRVFVQRRKMYILLHVVNGNNLHEDLLGN